MKRYPVLILGGYGNFGKRISMSLARDHRIAVLIAGRNSVKANALARTIAGDIPNSTARGYPLDIESAEFATRLRNSGARLVIHTSGPFQGQDYRVALACIEAGIDYIDLADDRRFVSSISQLAGQAREKEVLVISGASSVPGLSSAVIDQFLPQFKLLRSIRHNIAPGNRAERGEATVKAILSYTGQPFKRWQGGQWVTVYGWQDIHKRRYPVPIGNRWLASCDIPDLELFPQRYSSVEDVVFHAGLEPGLLHLGMYAMASIARLHLIDNWSRYARPITAMSRWFEHLGTDIGGMSVEMAGEDPEGKTLMITWSLIAGSGHGPEIPSIPAIILAKKLAAGIRPQPGAIPCMGLFTVQEFLDEVKDRDISQQIRTT
jgi:saccharopine dehydrogenase-like NADP-dependent oxidoreductase